MIEARRSTTYKPWSPSELLNITGNVPDYRKNPPALHRYIDRLREAYDATWQDLYRVVRMIAGEPTANEIVNVIKGTL